MRSGEAESDRPLICVTRPHALAQKGVMPVRRTLAPRSREEVAAHIRAQFTYATFDAFDYLNDQLLNLYWLFKDVTPERSVAGLCWCGCGEKIRGRQRYASQTCQKRCYRRAA
jgi:hypothetical protein